jgi:hypothetical protein
MVAIFLESVARAIIRHLLIRHCFQKCFQHLFNHFNRPFQGLFRHIAEGAKHWGERAARAWLPYILLMS